MTPPSNITREQILGCLLGGAVGDAVGGPYEGRSPPIEAQVPERLALSDDTQLTHSTCEAILQAQDVSPDQIAKVFVDQFQRRRLVGLGSSTLKSLRDLAAGAHWALSGASGPRSGGNGAAMRIAPAGLLLDPEVESDRSRLKDVASITHRHSEAWIGALAFTLALRASVNLEFNLETTPLWIADRIPDTQVRDGLLAIAELDPSTPPSVVAEEVGCSGFAAESIPLAIHIGRSMEGSTILGKVLDAISAGGDTDTIASMVGQLAGARLGSEALPSEELASIEGLSSITACFEQFADFVLRN